MNRFYVYLIRCRRPGWYYVGKGTGDRVWQSYEDYDGRDYKILLSNLTSEKALAVEKAVIAAMKFFGYSLYNRSEGGKGCGGYKFTEEQLERQRNRVYTEEWRKNISAAMATDEVRERRRQAILGSSHTVEARLKMSLAQRGVPKSEEHRRALSQTHTPERKEKIRRTKALRRASTLLTLNPVD